MLLPHLPFIHLRQHEFQSPERQFLWTLPQRNDFTVTDTQFCTGMGRVHPYLLLPFYKLRKSLLDRLDTFNSEVSSNSVELNSIFPAAETKLLKSLQLKTLPLLNRLECIPTGFRTMCRTFRALQRNLLELEGLVDYLLEHRTQGIETDPASKISITVGVFVYRIDDAVRYEAMGIRHWLIRPYEIVLQTPVHEIAYLLKPEQCELSPLRSRNSPCIFVGSASDPKLYAAISTFAQSLLGYPDPFNAVSLPEFIPPSSSLQSAGPQRQRALSAKERFAKTRSPCK